MPLDPRSVTPDGGIGDEPLWRKHFPVDAAEENSRSRRQFIGGLTLTGGVLACGHAAIPHVVGLHEDTDQRVDWPRYVLARKLSELTDGEAHMFDYPDRRTPCLLIRLSADKCVAFAQKCTHLACPVIPEPQAGQLRCPCHHGVFDMQSGAAIAGPPRAPLTRLQTEVSTDGTITVVGMAPH